MLLPGCSVDGVPEEAVARHLDPDYPGTAGPGVHPHPQTHLDNDNSNNSNNNNNNNNNPVHTFSFDRCRILKVLTASRMASDIRAISRAWTMPFRMGRPDTTM